MGSLTERLLVTAAMLFAANNVNVRSQTALEMGEYEAQVVVEGRTGEHVVYVFDGEGPMNITLDLTQPLPTIQTGDVCDTSGEQPLTPDSSNGVLFVAPKEADLPRSPQIPHVKRLQVK